VEDASNPSQAQEDNSAPAAAEAVEEEDDEIPCNDSHVNGETIKGGTVFETGEHFTKS
jgi:hypothetical protein